MPYLEVAGGRLYYETAGSPGPRAILLLHAGIASLRMWDPQVAELARRDFVVAFDARGFGRTETEDVEYSDRADAIALLDELGVASVVVIGCSRGGSLGIDLALEAPQRVDGLIAMGSSPGGFPQGELTEEEQRLADAIDSAEAAGDHLTANREEVEIWCFGPTRLRAALDPAFVAKAYELHAVNLAHVDERANRVPLEPRAYERVDRISVPTLVIAGDHDLSPILRAAAYLTETIQGAELYNIADSAHMPSVEHPYEVNALLADWLDRHEL